MGRVQNAALSISLAFALWVVYPATCYLLSRLYSRRMVADAEALLKEGG